MLACAIQTHVSQKDGIKAQAKSPKSHPRYSTFSLSSWHKRAEAMQKQAQRQTSIQLSSKLPLSVALQLKGSLRLLSSDHDNGKRTCTVFASFITQSTHACIFSRLDLHDQRMKKQMSQAATRQQQQAASTAATVPQLKILFTFGKDTSTLPQKGCGFLCTSWQQQFDDATPSLDKNHAKLGSSH